MKTLKLGTRKSLLAITQSTQVKHAIEAQNPEIKVELVGFTTQGDRQTDRPLHALDGKDFFVKELDHALRNGDVDFCVHSYKDLSSDRPSEFCIAAVPERMDLRDIIFFRPNFKEDLQNLEHIYIGSSSPRRAQNTPKFLETSLPSPHKIKKIEMKDLRGNVNTRLEKLCDPESEYDAIILALAGVSRLFLDDHSKSQIEPLVSKLNFMILPLETCAAAPAQGALAIECRKNDTSTREVLNTIHCPRSNQDVDLERTCMTEWGGGCHQKFGVSVGRANLDHHGVLFSSGISQNGVDVSNVKSLSSNKESNNSNPKPSKPWNGSTFKSTKSKTAPKFNFASIDNYVIAHPFALHDSLDTDLAGKNLWTSGLSSWEKLAKKGHWISGCLDSLGHDRVQSLSKNPLVQSVSGARWAALTHSTSDWAGITTIPTYVSTFPDLSDKESQELNAADSIWWASANQFKAYSKFANENASHNCGTGESYKVISNTITNVSSFYSVNQWEDSL